MNRKILLSLLSILIAFGVYGQNLSVDHLTGKLNASVSLFQLGYNDVGIPIEISSGGTGLKVQEGEGHCGLGWNLTVAGYGVFRQLRGLPDDYKGASPDTKRGWLFANLAQTINNFSPAADDNLSTCGDESNDWKYIDSIATNRHDTEPDVFFAQGPGLSVSFVFGTDGLPKLLSYQDVKIVVNRSTSGAIDNFVIQTNTGLVYTFSVKQSVKAQAFRYGYQPAPDLFLTDYYNFYSPVSYTASWYLSNVQSLSTKIKASFTYAGQDTQTSASFRDRIKADNTGDTLYYISNELKPLLLSSVSVGGYTAEFTWTNSLLDHIVVNENGYNEKKRFDFIYSSIGNEKTGLVHALKEIKQADNCIPHPSYVFSVSYGSLNTHAMDILDYPNGGESNYSKPTIYYYAGKTGAARFRIFPLPSTQPVTTTLTGDDRTPDEAQGRKGLLTSVWYPDGGKTLIEYENHTYYDSISQTEVYGGCCRVKSITVSGGEDSRGSFRSPKVPAPVTWHSIVTNYEYTRAGSSVSSAVNVYPPSYAFTTGSEIIRVKNNQAPEEGIFYTRVVERIAGQGSRVYEFDVPGTYPSATQNDWKAVRSKIARKPGSGCVSAGDIVNGPYTFPFAPNTFYDFERGSPRRVSEYAEDGTTLIRKKETSYKRVPQNATVIKGLKYEQTGGNIYHYALYTIPTGVGKAVDQEVTYESSEENASNLRKKTTTYTYNTSNFVQTISTTYDDGIITKQKFKYAKDFNTITAPVSMDWDSALVKLNATFQHGRIVESTTTRTLPGGTETVLNSNLTLYKNFGNNRVLPYKILTFPQATAFTQATVATVGSQQKISYDSRYEESVTYENYDGKSNLVDLYDNKKNRSSYHYTDYQTQPPVSISNARSTQVLYEGFEWNTGNGLTGISNGQKVQPGWTGEYAYSLASGNSLTSLSSLDKGSSVTTYRVSCWINAAQASTVTLKLKNVSTVVTSAVFSYPPAGASVNQWTYMESMVDVSALPAIFNVEIVSNATVKIDDILLIPKAAQVSLVTYKPLTGVTSQSDDRGNSIAFGYDVMGRKINTFDKKRNLVEYVEYQYQKDTPPSFSAAFTTTANTDYIVGYTTTFNVVSDNLPCNQQLSVSYVWKINGVVVGTNSPTLNYAFTSVGQHAVELTVTPSDPTYQALTHAENICVYPDETFSFRILPNVTTHYKCAGTYGEFIVKADPNRGMTTGCGGTTASIDYKWYIQSNQGWTYLPPCPSFPPISCWSDPSATPYVSYDLSASKSTLHLTMPNESITIRCDQITTCNALPDADCVGTRTFTVSQVLYIPYVDDTPCH
jgi:hypothetical protein